MQNSATTKTSPFFVNYGVDPKANFASPAPNAFTQHESVPATEEFAQRMKSSIHDENKSIIQIAQRSQASYCDKSKRPILARNIGDEFYLNTKNIQSVRPSKKLDHKRVGPFKIIEKIGSHAFKLDLPAFMKIHHPVFNAASLTPKSIDGLQDIENRQVDPAPPIVVVNGFEEYEVEEILDSRIKRNKLQYKIRWKNHPDPSEDTTWEDHSNVVNAPIPVRQFHDKYPNKPAPSTLKPKETSTTQRHNKKRRR